MENKSEIYWDPKRPLKKSRHRCKKVKTHHKADLIRPSSQHRCEERGSPTNAYAIGCWCHQLVQIWFCKVSGLLAGKQVCEGIGRAPSLAVHLSPGDGTGKEIRDGHSQGTWHLEELAQWVRTWVIKVHVPHWKVLPGVYSSPRKRISCFLDFLLLLPCNGTILHDLLKNDLGFTTI